MAVLSPTELPGPGCLLLLPGPGCCLAQVACCGVLATNMGTPTPTTPTAETQGKQWPNAWCQRFMLPSKGELCVCVRVRVQDVGERRAHTCRVRSCGAWRLWSGCELREDTYNGRLCTECELCCTAQSDPCGPKGHREVHNPLSGVAHDINHRTRRAIQDTRSCLGAALRYVWCCELVPYVLYMYYSSKPGTQQVETKAATRYLPSWNLKGTARRIPGSPQCLGLGSSKPAWGGCSTQHATRLSRHGGLHACVCFSPSAAPLQAMATHQP